MAFDETETYARPREFYGFVALASTAFLYVTYVIWALVPDSFLISAGIEWYPSREWAILVPAWTIVLILLAYFSYLAHALSQHPELSSLSTITDEYALMPSSSPSSSLGQQSPYTQMDRPDFHPELYDIPIGIVNKRLYLDRIPT